LGRKVTHEIFLEDLKRKQPQVYENFTIIGRYVKAKMPIEVLCNTCGGTTLRQPSNMLSGTGCSLCTTLGLERILDRLSETHSGYNLDNLHTIDNIKLVSRARITCPNNHTYETRVGKLLEGHCCQKCHQRSTRHSLEFIGSQLQYVSGVNLKMVSTKYTGVFDPLVINCEVHGDFDSTADRILHSKSGCTKCSMSKLGFLNKTIIDRSPTKYKEMNSGLYLLKINSPTPMYKIGLAKELKSRTCKLKRQTGFDIEVLYYKKQSVYEAYPVEQSILNIFGRISTDYRFNGYTEILDITEHDIEDVIYLINKHGERSLDET